MKQNKDCIFLEQEWIPAQIETFGVSVLLTYLVPSQLKVDDSVDLPPFPTEKAAFMKVGHIKELGSDYPGPMKRIVGYWTMRDGKIIYIPTEKEIEA